VKYIDGKEMFSRKAMKKKKEKKLKNIFYTENSINDSSFITLWVPLFCVEP